jgi:hypothetical protein
VDHLFFSEAFCNVIADPGAWIFMCDLALLDDELEHEIRYELNAARSRKLLELFLAGGAGSRIH